MNSHTADLSRARAKLTRQEQAKELKKQRKSRSILRLFSWTLMGNVVYAACQLGMLIIIAQLGTVRDVGVFSLALAVCAPVYMFTNMQLRGVIATDAAGQHRVGTYISLRIVSSLVAYIVVLGCAGMYWNDPLIRYSILLMGAAKCFESISDVLYGWWQKHERMDWSSKSLVLRGILSLVLFGVVYYVWSDLLIALSVYAMSWLLMLVLYDWPRAARISGFQWRSSAPFWWTLLKQCWPMGVVMMLVSLQPNIPRYYIAEAYDHDSLGYYSALVYVTVAVTTVVSALGQSISPRLSRAWVNHNQYEIRSVLIRALGMVAAIGAMAMLFIAVAGEWSLTVLYGSGYAEHYELFVLLIISAIVGSAASIYGYALTAARVFKAQVFINAVSVLLTMLILLVLILLGLPLISAGYTMLAVSVVNLLLTYLIWSHKLKRWKKTSAVDASQMPNLNLIRERG